MGRIQEGQSGQKSQGGNESGFLQCEQRMASCGQTGPKSVSFGGCGKGAGFVLRVSRSSCKVLDDEDEVTFQLLDSSLHNGWSCDPEESVQFLLAELVELSRVPGSLGPAGVMRAWGGGQG